MENQFVAGDRVKLISGGPEMTIRGRHYDVLTNEYRDDVFDCIWFDRNKEGRQEVRYCPFQVRELIKTGSAGDDW